VTTPTTNASTEATTNTTSIEKFTDLTFGIADGKIQFYLGGNPNPVPLTAGPPQNPHLELWALAMNLVANATGPIPGKPLDQTFAADLVALNAATSAADSQKIGIFILEVLCIDGSQGTFTSGIANAATMLFGDPADPNRLLTDVKARVQRCSPMILHK
jgi:hypothetical protein